MVTNEITEVLVVPEVERSLRNLNIKISATSENRSF